MFPLAEDDVRFVGDPVAMVVADDRYLAEDGAELVTVDYEPLEPVVDATSALDSRLVHPDTDSNLAGSTPVTDRGVAVLLDGATTVVERTLRWQRQAPLPMETRGVVARWSAEVGYELWLATQNPFLARRYLALILGVPVHQVRVVTGDVGGGFGLKFHMSREEVAVTAAARLLGRPLRWIEDRWENLVASGHARNDVLRLRVGFDAETRIVAGESTVVEDVGAYHLASTPALTVGAVPGPYRWPAFEGSTTSVHTNTGGRVSYRGPWAFGDFAREVVLDATARQLGVDPVWLRRRNLVTEADQPLTNGDGRAFHDVTAAACLEQLLAELDYEGFRAGQAAARDEGRLLGIGLSVYVEPTGFAGGTGDASEIRVDSDGHVFVTMSTASPGNSLETTMAQIVADELSIDLDQVTVLMGDTAVSPEGGGAGGSRQGMHAGGAAHRAAASVREQVLAVAAHLLEANPHDLELAGGEAVVQGTPTRSVTFAEVARAANTPSTLPPELAPGLQASARYAPGEAVTYASAAHACICEVDPSTGVVRLLRWVVSEDCGTMVNPAVVEGQVSGGVVQGIGGVLLEDLVYDAEGNPLASTLLDYLVPAAGDVPILEFHHVVTPSRAEGGYRGVGEGGAIVAPAAVVNAVADALGVDVLTMPLTPERVRALAAGGSGPGD
jgi:carbon-monoxide dehydrogenase large subunit